MLWIIRREGDLAMVSGFNVGNSGQVSVSWTQMDPAEQGANVVVYGSAMTARAAAVDVQRLCPEFKVHTQRLIADGVEQPVEGGL